MTETIPVLPKIKNDIAVVIIRHPQEQDEVLGSAPLIVNTLSNVLLKTGLSWPNAESLIGQRINNKEWAVLYLGSAKGSPDKILTFVDTKGNELAEPPELRSSISGIIVLDGTWSQAKAIWWRNPWLLKMHRVVLTPFAPSLYGKLRKEPRRESVSTAEAVAATLAELGEPVATSKALVAAFRKHLDKIRSEKKANPAPKKAGRPGARKSARHVPLGDKKKSSRGK